MEKATRDSLQIEAAGALIQGEPAAGSFLARKSEMAMKEAHALLKGPAITMSVHDELNSGKLAKLVRYFLNGGICLVLSGYGEIVLR